MPTYSYRCSTCGPFAAVRRMAEFDLPAPCPVCATVSARTLTVPAQLGARNRSTQRPYRFEDDKDDKDDARATYGRLSHAGGCDCCL